MSKRIDLHLLLTVLAALGSAWACGGSSSETPPPLEPDPRGNNYLGNYGKAALPADEDGGTPVEPSRAENAPVAEPAARSTWGSGKSNKSKLPR